MKEFRHHRFGLQVFHTEIFIADMIEIEIL
jgi:hypothetical protein